MTASVLVTREAMARARLRLMGLVVVQTCIGLGLLVVLAVNARDLGTQLDGLGLGAVVAIAVLGTVLILAMVPASLVAGAAGFALGTPGGMVVALATATAGAVACAVVGRAVGTPAARHALGTRIAASAAWLDERPLRAVITARLVPGLPFNAMSYVLGFTAIRMRDIALGTAIGFAPRCFAYTALGGSLRDLGSPEARVALGASVVLALIVVLAPRLLLRDAAPMGHPTQESLDG